MMAVECDVIVVGAGIAGVGVAAALATDRRVILLEMETHPGTHATGRSAALHSEIYGNSCIRSLTRASREFFVTGSDGLSFASERGCVYIATEDQLDRLAEFEAQPSVGPAVDRIGGDAVRAMLPVLRPGIVVAALAERNAFDLDVDAIHRFFLKQFRQRSGSIRCSAGVTSMRFERGKWMVEAGGASIHAPVVVNAAGAWGDHVARLGGIAPIGLEPMRRSALLVDPPQGVSPNSWPVAIDIDEKFYFKPEAGKILMSPADETPMEPCDAYPEDLDLAIAVDRVQQVADIPVERISHSWAGLRTFVPDRTPVVGYDADAPGFFWLVGQGGYGIQTSPALSRLAAALIVGDRIPDDLAPIQTADLSPARLRGSAKIQSSTPEAQSDPVPSTTN